MGSGSFDTNQAVEAIGGMAASRVSGAVGRAQETVDGAMDLARDMGYRAAEDGSDWLSKLVKGITDFFKMIVEKITGVFDRAGGAARNLVSEAITNGRNVLQGIGSALGLGNSDSTVTLIETTLRDFASNLPAMGENNSQGATKQAIFTLHGELAEQFTGKFSTQYPNASVDTVLAAADRAAGIIVGYPDLRSDGNATVQVNRMGDATPGSVGDLMLRAQLRGRGPRESRDSVTINPLRIGDALAEVRASLTGAAQPPAAAESPAPAADLAAQVQPIVLAAKAQGIGLSRKFNVEGDASGADSVTTAEVVATLRSKGITDIANVTTPQQLNALVATASGQQRG